jgi:hypothetical protein
MQQSTKGKDMKSRMHLFAIGLALFAGNSMAADGLKAGQWDMTITMKMKNMPQMSAEELAAMKQMGMKMPGMGEPVHTMHCVTPEQAASNQPVSPIADPSCTVSNLKKSGSTTSGNLTCKGHMNGTGKFETTMKNDSFISKMSLKGESGGQPVDQEMETSGKWLKAKCDPGIPSK